MSDRKISLQLTVSSSDSESESDKCVATHVVLVSFTSYVILSSVSERRKLLLPWTIRFHLNMVRWLRESEGPRQSTPKVRLSSVSLGLASSSG